MAARARTPRPSARDRMTRTRKRPLASCSATAVPRMWCTSNKISKTLGLGRWAPRKRGRKEVRNKRRLNNRPL